MQKKKIKVGLVREDVWLTKIGREWNWSKFLENGKYSVYCSQMIWLSVVNLKIEAVKMRF